MQYSQLIKHCHINGKNAQKLISTKLSMLTAMRLCNAFLCSIVICDVICFHCVALMNNWLNLILEFSLGGFRWTSWRNIGMTERPTDWGRDGHTLLQTCDRLSLKIMIISNRFCYFYNSQINRQTNRQTNRQINRQTNRWADIPSCRDAKTHLKAHIMY